MHSASPSPQRLEGPGKRVLMLPIAAAVWAVFMAGAMVLIPRYEEIFRDFGVALPLGARASLEVARWLTGRNPGQVVPGAAVLAPALMLLAGAGFVRCDAGVVRGLLLALAILLIAAALAAAAVTMVSMFVVMTQMTQSLQGGGSV